MSSTEVLEAGISRLDEPREIIDSSVQTLDRSSRPSDHPTGWLSKPDMYTFQLEDAISVARSLVTWTSTAPRQEAFDLGVTIHRAPRWDMADSEISLTTNPEDDLEEVDKAPHAIKNLLADLELTSADRIITKLRFDPLTASRLDPKQKPVFILTIKPWIITPDKFGISISDIGIEDILVHPRVADSKIDKAQQLTETYRGKFASTNHPTTREIVHSGLHWVSNIIEGRRERLA